MDLSMKILWSRGAQVALLMLAILGAHDNLFGEDAVAMEKGKAIFAGGCFWCMEGPFEAHPGVTSVLPGYTEVAPYGPLFVFICS